MIKEQTGKPKNAKQQKAMAWLRERMVRVMEQHESALPQAEEELRPKASENTPPLRKAA